MTSFNRDLQILVTSLKSTFISRNLKKKEKEKKKKKKKNNKKTF